MTHKNKPNQTNSRAQSSQLERENEQLKDDIKLLHNRLREMDDEVTYLQAYIVERGRLRSLVKELILKFDRIITTHLTKRLKDRKRYPAIHVSGSETDPKAILKALQAADHKVFVTPPTPWQRIDTGFFKTVYGTYSLIRRLIFRSLRFVFRKLRPRKQVSNEI